MGNTGSGFFVSSHRRGSAADNPTEVLVEVDDLEVKLNRGGPLTGNSPGGRGAGYEDSSSAPSADQSSSSQHAAHSHASLGAGASDLVSRTGGGIGGAGAVGRGGATAVAQLSDLFCRELYPGGAPQGSRAFADFGLVGTEQEQLSLLSYYAILSEDFQRYQRDACRTTGTTGRGPGESTSGSGVDSRQFSTDSESKLQRQMRRDMERISLGGDVHQHRSGGGGDNAWPQLVLLSGPPGTGKTQHTQAWARAMGLPLIVVDQKQDGWLGKLDASIGNRDCIVFFDELDGFFSDGARSSGGSSCNPRFPTQFRQFLDGTARSERNRDARVLVAGTTNQLHQIPADIVHRGEVIEFAQPSRESFGEIVGKYAAHLQGPGVEKLAALCSNAKLTARDFKVCAGFAERWRAIEFLNGGGGAVGGADEGSRGGGGGGYAHGNGLLGCAPPELGLYERCLRKRGSTSGD